MTEKELIGTWECMRTVRFGKEKVHKKAESTMTFNADGTGTVRLLFIPLPFRWTLNNGVLEIMNSTDGKEIPSEVRGNAIIMNGTEDSYTIYEKMQG